MSFRLVPKSVTLNDLERRNRPNGCLISSNSVAFRADCVKVVEDTRILSAADLPPSLHRFRDIALERSKIAIFGYPYPPRMGSPGTIFVKFLSKDQVAKVPNAVETLPKISKIA